MGGLGVKVQHFPLTLLVVLTTLTLPCERDYSKWQQTDCHICLSPGVLERLLLAKRLWLWWRSSPPNNFMLNQSQ